MNKVILSIKKYATIIVVAIIAILLIVDQIDKHSNTIENQFDLQQWKSQYQDSLKKAEIESRNTAIEKSRKSDSILIAKGLLRIDSLEKANNILSKRNKVKKESAQGAVQEYEKDTTSHTLKCDSAISKLVQWGQGLEDQVDTLQQQVNESKEVISRQKNSNDSYSQEVKNMRELLTTEERQSKRVELINQQLRDQIKKDNNWWHRNEKWIYLGAGVVTTGLILK